MANELIPPEQVAKDFWNIIQEQCAKDGVDPQEFMHNLMEDFYNSIGLTEEKDKE